MGTSRGGQCVVVFCLIILVCNIPHAASEDSRRLLKQSNCKNGPSSAPPGILMHMTIDLLRAESVNGSSEPCVAQLLGSGIFTPPNVGRGIKVVAEAMYNAWTFFDLKALPTVGPKVLAKASEYKNPCKTCAMALASYKAMAFLLPEGVVRMDVAGKIKTGLGVDVLAANGTSPCSDAIPEEMGVWINEKVSDMLAALSAAALTDGFNQANCYADLTGVKLINKPTVLDSPETIADSAANLTDALKFSQWVLHGAVDKPKPFTSPSASQGVPFGLCNSSAVRPPPLPSKKKQAQLLKEVATVYGTKLWQRQGYNKLIAEFWADGPKTYLPPGHWIDISILVASRYCYTQDKTVRLLFAVAAAMHDACIASWDAKVHYQSARSLTFIPTQLPASTLPNQYAGPYCPATTIKGVQWLPYQPLTFLTPHFPGYVSGHSTFSRAAATVLVRFTGSDVMPGGYAPVIAKGTSKLEPYCGADGLDFKGNPCVYTVCHDPRPAFGNLTADASKYNSATTYLPLQDTVLGPWRTFSQMAESAGVSRLYGGIHTALDNSMGQQVGERVGLAVWEKATAYFLGKPSRRTCKRFPRYRS